MCCPHYTIRADSNTVKIKRDQRQTINKFNRFVLGDKYIADAARLYPKSKEDAKKRDNDFNLAERIHEAEYSQLKIPPQPEHRFEVTLEEDNFTQEKFAVYDNYQTVVHRDEPDSRTAKGFKQFLCNSPLRRQTIVGQDGRKRNVGSYHQCYRLDGKLVAIGVLDLLPDCVSSVYFLYDESIHKFSPGKLAALRELALAQEEGYKWWYPGYYIHGCVKMRYKAEYRPMEMLDPVSLTWEPFDDETKAFLDQKPFVSISEERSAATDGKDAEARQASTEDADEDMKDEDEDEDFATASLFDSNMPGIASIDDFGEETLDHVPVRIKNAPRLFETSDLVAWDDCNMADGPNLKTLLAEMVAAMGMDCLDEICLAIN